MWDQVRKEDDLGKAIVMIANLTEQAVNERMSETEQIRSSIVKLNEDVHTDFRSIQKTLFGNGDPSHSIIARLERIEEMQCKASENVNKASWIVVSAIIVQVVMYLLKVL